MCAICSKLSKTRRILMSNVLRSRKCLKNLTMKWMEIKTNSWPWSTLLTNTCLSASNSRSEKPFRLLVDGPSSKSLRLSRWRSIRILTKRCLMTKNTLNCSTAQRNSKTTLATSFNNSNRLPNKKEWSTKLGQKNHPKSSYWPRVTI